MTPKKKTKIKKLSWSNSGGNPIQKIFKRVWDKEKCRYVVKCVGEYNIAEKIQASNNVSDLALFYKQLDSGLVTPPETGSDEIKGSDELLPRNIHEFKKNVNKAYSSFDKLPKELKAAFKGDQSIYLKSLADGTYLNHVNEYLKTLSKTTTVVEKGENLDGK